MVDVREGEKEGRGGEMDINLLRINKQLKHEFWRICQYV